MAKILCPACGKLSLSRWQFLVALLPFARNVKCAECKITLSVPPRLRDNIIGVLCIFLALSEWMAFKTQSSWPSVAFAVLLSVFLLAPHLFARLVVLPQPTGNERIYGRLAIFLVVCCLGYLAITSMQ